MLWRRISSYSLSCLLIFGSRVDILHIELKICNTLADIIMEYKWKRELMSQKHVKIFTLLRRAYDGRFYFHRCLSVHRGPGQVELPVIPLGQDRGCPSPCPVPLSQPGEGLHSTQRHCKKNQKKKKPLGPTYKE